MGLEVFDNYECDGQMEITDCTGNRQLTHLSLFTGIGGLDLAAEWAGFKSVGQCEWADYPTKVLEKHWPDVERWRDIRELQADEFIRRTGIKPGELTVISGGFPCQPHSTAGLRKASSDERDLWPEYRRVVSEIKPRWVVAENVRGLLSSESGRFFRGILRDFADMGYDVGWCCYRAADIGAIHARERVAIIAHINSLTGAFSVFDRNSREIKEWDKGKKVRCKNRKQSKMGSGFDERIYTWTGQLGKSRLVRVGSRTSGEVDEIRDRLTALGNMVVPQQFYPIFQAIADIELHR